MSYATERGQYLISPSAEKKVEIADWVENNETKAKGSIKINFYNFIDKIVIFHRVNLMKSS